MLPCVWIVINHWSCQNVLRTSVTNSATLWVPCFCSYHIWPHQWSITELMQVNMESFNYLTWNKIIRSKCIQLNPSNSNCQEKLKLLWVIGVLNKNTRNTWSIPDYEQLFLFPGENCHNYLFMDMQTCDIDKG